MSLPDLDSTAAAGDARKAYADGDHRFAAMRIAGSLSAPGLSGIALELPTDESKAFHVFADLAVAPDSLDPRAAKLVAYVTAYNGALLAELMGPLAP